MSEENTAPAPEVLDRMANFFGAAKQTVAEAPAEAVEAEATEEAPAEEEAVAAEGGETEQPDQPETEPTADPLVEVEFDGKLHRVDPSIKDALMRQSDYTKKTMALADQTRLFQQQQQMAALQEGFRKESEPETQKLAKLEGQIDQFKALNWAEMDTDSIVRARQALDSIKEQRDEAKAALKEKEGKYFDESAKARQQLLQQGAEYLKKTIGGWGEVSSKDSAQAALSVGFTKDEVSQFMDPRAVHLAWKAAQWDKLQASKPSVAQKVKTAPPMAKPGSAATTESSQNKQYVQLRQDLKKTGSDKLAMAAIMNRMGK